jgi:phosphoglycerate-specific signal transduction histidine kinase
MIADAERPSSVVNRVRALARKDPSEHRLIDLNAVINDVVKLVAREIASQQSMIPKSGDRFSDKIMLQQ